MQDDSRREAALATMHRINQAWLAGRVEDLVPHLHPDIVMAFPGFSGRTAGCEPFLAGFRDFCQNARVHAFEESERQADVAGRTAVVTYRYQMLYERAGQTYRASGRDFWVFEEERGTWRAVWRTMLDLCETAVGE